MSAKTELYDITRELRRYLEWQRRSGVSGAPAASPSQRDAFEALDARRRARELERTRRGLMGEDAPSTPSAPRTPRPKAAQKSPQGAPLSGLQEAVKPPKPLPADQGGDKPWKRFGSRPKRTFARADKPNPRPQHPSPPSDTSPADGPQYDEFAYPEAAGIAADSAPDLGPTQTSADSSTPRAESMSNADKLAYLRDYLGDCQRCRLCQTRTHVVFGDGNPRARLVFVGEAPGFHEDKQGVPFVGKAGDLLTKMIEAMGLTRDDVYICNVLKCRPPDNRNPRPDEIRECSPFLKKQLQVVQPEVIVGLGKFASQWLVGADQSMGELRGQWHQWQGIAVMPTYHPAYLLRQPQQKASAWADLQLVMQRLGL